jgi:erythromycin esterase-like protein
LSFLVTAALALAFEGRLAPERSQAARTGERAPTTADLVVRDLCDKRIALLGEPSMHGFGRTLEFKAEVVRRLVDECRFSAFFIESGAYDFLNIRRALQTGKTVTPPSIAAAIGGLWANREVEPLIPFLAERVQSGVLVLGGLDDQLGRGTYAQNQMPADLVAVLPPGERAACLATLQRHTLWRYTSEAPYREQDKVLILDCLGRMEAGLPSARPVADRELDLAMIENLRRTLARDFAAPSPSGPDLNTWSFNRRDRSMYENFSWLMARLPARSKAIVWTATIHAASDLSGVPGQEQRLPLGSYIRREFKSQAFVLGFSASSGSYALGRQPARPLDPAPAASIEGLAAGNSPDPSYFDPGQIRRLGRIAARPLGPDFRTAKWADVLDGLVVFREEHPPHVSAMTGTDTGAGKP